MFLHINLQGLLYPQCQNIPMKFEIDFPKENYQQACLNLQQEQNNKPGTNNLIRQHR